MGFVFVRDGESSSELFLVRAAGDRFELLEEIALPVGGVQVESLSEDLARPWCR
ncbi:MAG TPA: hypothetical protein VIL20_04910 [Sandaracinaceae bacterium]